MFALFLAQTSSAAPASPASPGGGFGMFVPFIFSFVIMYFIMIRPQQRRQKEQQKLISALKTGDRVVTSSGWSRLASMVPPSAASAWASRKKK
jgi:preprotein translocase subunit YajC